jgi:hypothetical protein
VSLLVVNRATGQPHSWRCRFSDRMRMSCCRFPS